MPQNFYELLWIFIIYAFIGWCAEVGYAAVNRRIFVNRGFLNGPYCPIYGSGVVIVVAALTPLKENLIVLFIGSFLLTSLLEFFTGFLLEKVFHDKWWDYSNLPFNIKGYVCLKFSIYWGMACVFIMDILHPIIYKFITVIPHVLGMVFISILMTVFAVDVGITVATILKLNKRLKAMDEVAKQIHKVSDEIGEKVYENVTTFKEKSEEFQETHEDLLTKIGQTKDNISAKTDEKKLVFNENLMELKSELNYRRENMYNNSIRDNEFLQKSREEREKKKAELVQLKEKYKTLMAQKNYGFKRLLSAFPDMKSRDWNQVLEEYKKHFK